MQCRVVVRNPFTFSLKTWLRFRISWWSWAVWHVHSIVTISGHCFHSTSTDTLLPITMQGSSKETVQRKPNWRSKLKDEIKARFSPSQPSRTATPGLPAQGESSKTGGDADVGKHLQRLDRRQGLMSETYIQQGRGPTQFR